MNTKQKIISVNVIGFLIVGILIALSLPTLVTQKSNLITVYGQTMGTASNASTNETLLDVNEEANELINAASNALTNATENAIKATGTTMTPGQMEALINYCFEHAERPNPIQDLIDKGFLPEGFSETCKSVKHTYDKFRTIADKNLEIQQQKQEAASKVEQEKVTSYNKCILNTLNSTTTYEDCYRIYNGTTTNTKGTAMDEAQDILGTAMGTGNATGELMSRADNVLSLVSDAGANATQRAMNKTMNLLGNMSNNISDTVSNTLTDETELDGEFDDNSGVGYYDPPYSYAQCLTVFTQEQCDFRFNSN
jgi:hypothetical protein